MGEVEELNGEITRRSIELRQLYETLAELHERLADRLDPRSDHGETTRRTAVSNAHLAGLDDMAAELTRRYLDEEGCSERLRRFLLGNGLGRPVHLQCRASEAALQELMSRTVYDEDAVTLGAAVLALREAAEEIELWKAGGDGRPPFELREAIGHAKDMLQSLMSLDELGGDEEQQAVVREATEAMEAVLERAKTWVTYHGTQALWAASAGRGIDMFLAEAEVSKRGLLSALQGVMESGSLEEARAVAWKELKIQEESGDEL